MGRICSMHGSDKKCIKNFGQKALEDLSMDRGILLKWSSISGPTQKTAFK
jgi:hypothetical protein